MTTPEPKMEILDVTPVMAGEMLDRNPRNRRPSPGHQRQIARDMKQGEFPMLFDPIRFDTDGVLLDGQQRLQAVVDSGVTTTFLVITGLPPETQRYMDIGRKRSAADQSQIEGVTDPALKSAIAKLLLQWDRKSVLSHKFRPSVAEIVRFIQDEPQLFHNAATVARKVRADVQIPGSVIGAVYIKAAMVDPQNADLFFEHLASGAGLGEGSPILAFRRLVARRQRDGLAVKPHEYLYYLVAAWTKWVDGTSASALYQPRGGVRMEHIPLIVDCGRTTGGDES